MRAFKVGRAELAYCRQHMEQNAPYSALIAHGCDRLYGTPFYEVGRATYFEAIYQDEAPTLDVLNERLMAEPAAVGGRVTAGGL